MRNRHFEWTFWFIAGATGLVMVYIFLVTFIPIPKENIRFADTALSFLLGTVIGNTFGYLVSATPFTSTKPTNNDKQGSGEQDKGDVQTDI
jgi:hypothetical protein